MTLAEINRQARIIEQATGIKPCVLRFGRSAWAVFIKEYKMNRRQLERDLKVRIEIR